MRFTCDVADLLFTAIKKFDSIPKFNYDCLTYPCMHIYFAILFLLQVNVYIYYYLNFLQACEDAENSFEEEINLNFENNNSDEDKNVLPSDEKLFGKYLLSSDALYMFQYLH